jgi:hypothetical protein
LGAPPGWGIDAKEADALYQPDVISRVRPRIDLRRSSIVVE